MLARDIPSYFQVTGSLSAQETSDVAPQTSGQIVATPVSVGAFVRQGDVIARLNPRDAQLRYQQAQASVQQAIAGVRQAEARLGLRPGGNFDASTIPEVRAASSSVTQAQADLRLAEANEKRYRALVETGDVALSVYDQYRTQRDTARARLDVARQQLEVASNTARQSNQAILSAQAAVESARSQAAIAQQAVADTTIRAPYAGYISNRPVAVVRTMGAGSPLPPPRPALPPLVVGAFASAFDSERPQAAPSMLTANMRQIITAISHLRVRSEKDIRCS